MEKIYYAIGDIHGRHNEFLRLIKRINDDIQKNAKNKEVFVVQVGDIIDRGENSKACVETIINFQTYFPNNVKAIALQGNHEEILCKLWHNKTEELQDKEAFYWFHHDIGGGIKTLQSYDPYITIPEKPYTEKDVIGRIQDCVPEQHIKFLEKLPITFTNGEYFFCHAGIDPKIPISKQNEHTLRWIREPFLSHSEKFEKIIVHGHSPASEGEIQHNRVNTDAAAAYGEKLKCFILPESYNMNDVRSLEVPIKAPSSWGNLTAFKEKIKKAKNSIINGNT